MDSPTLRPIVKERQRPSIPVSVHALVDAMCHRGLSARIGVHAGTFLCNRHFVRVLRGGSGAKHGTGAFVHIPPGIDEQALIDVLVEFITGLETG